MQSLVMPESPRFVLMGAGYHLCAFARILVEAGFPPPVILTYPKAQHERDRVQIGGDPGLYSYVFDVAQSLGLQVIEAEKVNDIGLIDRLIADGCSAAFSLSCRSIIRRPFIDAFGGRVFNIHPSPLPEERGGGIFTWRILRGQRHVAVTIHMIDEGIDTGAIVSQDSISLQNEHPIPADFMRATNKLYAAALLKFTTDVKAGKEITPTPQDDSRSTYLPRLCTEVNGAIDWRWDSREIERFIRAYSHPYSGAFTFAGDKRIAILEADFDGYSGNHPAMRGKAIRVYPDGSVRVVAKGAYLRLRKVNQDNQEVPAAQAVNLMDTLHTPTATLEAAHSRLVGIKEMSARLA